MTLLCKKITNFFYYLFLFLKGAGLNENCCIPKNQLFIKEWLFLLKPDKLHFILSTQNIWRNKVHNYIVYTVYCIGTKLQSTLDITYTVYCIATKLQSTLDITYTLHFICTKLQSIPDIIYSVYRIGTKILSTLDIKYTVYCIGTKLQSTLDII